MNVKHFLGPKGLTKASIPGAQESPKATESVPCLVGTSCYSGKQPATPGAEGPGREARAAPGLFLPRGPRPRLHLAPGAPSLPRAPMSRASLAGREIPQGLGSQGEGSGEKCANVGLEELPCPSVDTENSFVLPSVLAESQPC